MPALRHTASLEERVKVLGESISEAIKTGDRVRDLYEAAKRTVLTRDEAATLFDALFPPAYLLATKRELTKARAMRDEARQAAAMAINDEGPTLATLWNAATYVVDREGTSPRPVRGGGSQLESMVLGSRGERVNEVMTLIEVILRDGTTQTVTAPQALELGVDQQLVGRKVLAEIIEAYVPPAA